MPLLSFEGVEVEMPPKLEGLRFCFINGKLAIECSNFTGTIALSKGSGERSTPTKSSPMTTPKKRSASSSPVQAKAKANGNGNGNGNGSSVAPPVIIKEPILLPKKLDHDFQTTSDQDSLLDSGLFSKSIKPNFLNQIEQSMLLAQFDATQATPDSQLTQQQQTRQQKDKREDSQAKSRLLQALEKDKDSDNDDDDDEFLPEPEQEVIISASLTPCEKENVAPPASPRRVNNQHRPVEKNAKKTKSEDKEEEPRVPLKKRKTSNALTSPLVARKKTHQTTLLGSPPPAKQQTKAAKKRNTRAAANSVSAAATTATEAPPATGKKTKGVAKAADRMSSSSHQLVTILEASIQTIETSGVTPAERWGHTATSISNKQVVLYGGANDDEDTLNDLFVLDLSKNEWSQPLNCESIPRAWHDAVFLESKNLMLVFGGERTVGKATEALSDIMVLDTQCFLWYPPAVTGAPPTSRSGHSCTVVGNDVVVFGGSKGRTRQNSVFVLDTEKWNWRTLKIDGKPPSPRTYHSAVCVGDSVVIFGGNDAKTSFNSVHVLRRKQSNENAWSWFHPCAVGSPPCPRTGHSATLVNEYCVLVFGGWDPQSDGTKGITRNTVFQDAFLLNTLTWEWSQVELRQEGQEEGSLLGRVGHRSIWDEYSHRVVLFGGQDGDEKRLNLVQSIALTRPEAGKPEDDGAQPTTGNKRNPIQL